MPAVPDEQAAINVAREHYVLPDPVTITHTDTAWTIWAKHPTNTRRDVEVVRIDKVTGRLRNLPNGHLFQTS